MFVKIESDTFSCKTKQDIKVNLFTLYVSVFPAADRILFRKNI